MLKEAITRIIEKNSIVREYIDLNQKFYTTLEIFNKHLEYSKLEKAFELVGFFTEYNASMRDIMSKISSADRVDEDGAKEYIIELHKKITEEANKALNSLKVHSEITAKTIDTSKKIISQISKEDSSYNKRGVVEVKKDALTMLAYEGVI
jgi:hypothetical protein